MPKTRSAPPDTDRNLTFDEILGHRPVVEYLTRSIRDDQLPQAILFTGPQGVGKKTLAWALVRQIAAGGADPATHRGSLKVARATHPDVYICDGRGSPSGQILIGSFDKREHGTIRDADDWLATMPLEAAKKFLLIAPAERMNEHAANALLKVLEEPPPHALIMLICADPSRLLPTIRSRCTPLALDAVAAEELIPWLKRQIATTADQAELAARIAEGRPGHALSMIESGALDLRGKILSELQLLRTHGFAVVFRIAERFATMGKDIDAVLQTALMILRDCLSISLKIDRILNRDLESELRTLADGLSPEAVLGAANLLADAMHETHGLYTPQAKAHFLEILVTGIGQALKAK